MIIDSFPEVIRIEPSGICNFRCVHCSSHHINSQRGLLSVELFDSIFEGQFKENSYAPRIVVLYHGGEPLLNDNIQYFVRKAKETGASVKIVSNASHLTIGVAKELLQVKLDFIEFSFDGTSSIENDALRLGGNFERDSANVLSLLDLIKEQSSNLQVSISNVQIYTQKQLEQYNEFGTVIDIPLYLKDRFKGYSIDYKSFPAMKWPSYNINYAPNKYDVLSFPSTTPVNYCSNSFETATILSNGDVVPCCYDINGVVVFGNVKKDNIFAIWESKDAQQFRQSIRNGNPPELCKECMLFRREFLTTQQTIEISI